MAHALFIHPATGPLARLRATLAFRLDRLRARRAAYRQAWNELDAMSDRELAELGLSRADIGSLARAEADKL